MVDIFNITREEITMTKEKTIESLINTNRELKLNFQNTRSSVQNSKKIMEDPKENFSKKLAPKNVT